MKRIIFFVLGMLFLVIGIVNRFIPGLPTTPLLILSSMCFANSSPKMQQWLINSKFLGPYLDNYYNKRGMPTGYKLRTCAFMFSGMFFAVTLVPFWWLQILIPLIGTIVSIHIFSAKKRSPSDAELSPIYHLKTVGMCWLWLGIGLFMANTPFDYYFLGVAGGVLTIIVLTYAALSTGAKGLYVWTFLTVLVTVGIFISSSMEGDVSGAASMGFVEHIRSLLGGLYWLSDDTLHFLVRKGAHFAVFFSLAFCLVGVMKHLSEKKALIFWHSFGVASLYGAFDEVHQIFVEGRAFMFMDIGINAAGALFGAALAYLLFVRKS
ncbi:MAG: VanZ family protein [Defluviitaleaceae bacterium]|nr:VanZ family protein [Defluviitaleaceae bacterium]